MLPLGLSSAQLRAFHSTLVQHHSARVRVHILKLDQTPVADVSAYLLDGQVNVDASADVTRTLSLTLLDPTRSLSVDANSPNDAALYMDRMVRVEYGVLVGDEWQWVPVFTGPVTQLSRDGDQISVDASGKEALAMSAMWRPLTIRKGTTKTAAIRTILRERAGETLFDFTEVTSRVPKTQSYARDAVPWVAAKAIASSMNRQLFYDGRGVCRLRANPGTVSYGFTGSSMLGQLQVSYTSDSLANTVFVTGAVPKGKKTAITATAVAPASHPLSPQNLGRNGVPRYLLSSVQDDHLRTYAEAEAVAKTTLARSLLESVSASFDALPIPHLEPGDVIHASTDDVSFTLRLSSFALPLGVGNAMTVGYLRNVSPKARKSSKPRRAR